MWFWGFDDLAVYVFDSQLIHMNGRVYDYNLGRFLSVDPFIQEPGNSQSMNPYSYIMNNPLAGTDPTGYAMKSMTESFGKTVYLSQPRGKAPQAAKSNGAEKSQAATPTVTANVSDIGGQADVGKQAGQVGKDGSSEGSSESAPHTGIVNTTTDGKTKSHLSKGQKREVDSRISKLTSDFSFRIFENLEGEGGLVESLDVELMRLSKDYDIEVGFHIYQIEGGGYFASEIHTGYLSDLLLGGEKYLIPKLDKNLIGGYHTHGATGSDNFSSRDIHGRLSGDISYAVGMYVRSGNPLYRFYVSSPSGSLKAFDAGKWNEAVMNAEQVKFGSGSQIDFQSYIRRLR